MKSTKTLLCLATCIVLSSSVLLQSGCVVVAAGAGAGAVAWVRGDLQATVSNSVADVVKASTKAVQKMKFALVSEKQDVLTGEVIARTIDDKRIKIVAKAETSGVTTIIIRVDVFGDQRVSQALLDKIKENL